MREARGIVGTVEEVFGSTNIYKKLVISQVPRRYINDSIKGGAGTCRC